MCKQSETIDNSLPTTDETTVDSWSKPLDAICSPSQESEADEAQNKSACLQHNPDSNTISRSICISSVSEEPIMDSDEEQNGNSFTYSLYYTDDNVSSLLQEQNGNKSIHSLNDMSDNVSSLLQEQNGNKSTHSRNDMGDNMNSPLHSICSSSQESLLVDENDDIFPFAELSCSIFREECDDFTKFRGNFLTPQEPAAEHNTEAKDEVELVPQIQMDCSDEHEDKDECYTQDVCSPLENADSHNSSTLDKSNLEEETARNEIPKRISRSQRFRQRINSVKNFFVDVFHSINCFSKQEIE